MPDSTSLCDVFNFDDSDLSHVEEAVQALGDVKERSFLKPSELLESLAKKWSMKPFSKAFASKLDGLNNFDFRDQFQIPRRGMLPEGYGKASDGESRETIYLCSHSLGLKPKALDGYIKDMLEKWGDWGVLTQFHGRFAGKDIDEAPKSLMNKVVGAKQGETTLMNGLSINIHLLFIHFYQPSAERYKIMIEEHAFPSDMYIVKSQLKLHGISEEEGLVLLKRRDGEFCIREEDIHDAIVREGDKLACILLPGVQYLSGYRFDIEKITKWAHDAGTVIGWDLAHAVCNVPLNLHDWNVDFACWCTYKKKEISSGATVTLMETRSKLLDWIEVTDLLYHFPHLRSFRYMCGGQGCHGGIFVHERLWGHEGPKLEGWWGTKDSERFKMKSYIEPALGADSFRISNPSAWATVPVIAALEVFDQVDWDLFRQKQFWLTGYMELVVEKVSAQLARDFPQRYDATESVPIKVVTPKDPQRRGSQLSMILSGDTRMLSEELLKAGVICDFRYPDRLRAAPSPMYTRYEEVYNFGRILLEILELPYKKQDIHPGRTPRHVIPVGTACSSAILSSEKKMGNGEQDSEVKKRQGSSAKSASVSVQEG